MSVLLDTNVLMRSVESKHPMHGNARQAVAVLLRSGETLGVVPQNLYEFWVASTRPVAQNGLGFSVPQADAELQRLSNQLKIFEDIPTIRREWENLVVRYAVVGKNAHDARLVAAM